MRESTTGPLPGARRGGRDDQAAEAFMQIFMPLASPPEGELPDADEVTALVEGRLLPDEVAQLIRRIDGSAAARSELAALSPRIFARHFPEKRPPLHRWSKPRKVLAFGALAALAAAVVAAFVVPYAAPEGASLSVQARPMERGAPKPDGQTMRPTQWATLQLTAGVVRPFDTLRGGAAWVTLYQVDPVGGITRLCSSADSSCALVGGRVPLSWRAPSLEGTYTLVLLGGSHNPSAADRLEGQGGLPALEAAAAASGWTAQRQTLEVRR